MGAHDDDVPLELFKAFLELIGFPESGANLMASRWGKDARERLEQRAARALAAQRELRASLPPWLTEDDADRIQKRAVQVIGQAAGDADVLVDLLVDPSGAAERFMQTMTAAGTVDIGEADYLRASLLNVSTSAAKVIRGAEFHDQALMAGVAELVQATRETQGKQAGIPIAAQRLQEASAKFAGDTRAHTLPEVSRLAELHDQVLSGRFPLAILGEGGLGKSVIAGQVFRHHDQQAPGHTLFCPCSQIPASADTSTLEALDVALGSTLVRGRRLTDIMDAVAGCVLVIDTLDLILTERNADDLTQLLDDLSHQCRLVVTCRGREWDDLLDPGDDSPFAEFRLPRLSRDQVLAWSCRFIDAHPELARGAAFLASLENALVRKNSLDLFGSPVRLAMACEIYAVTGSLPEDLTVTSLYSAYWEAKVARDRRARRGAEAQEREQAAICVAEGIWTTSTTRFTEFVGLSPSHGSSALLSEGILQQVGLKVGFFHQTFAEYAVARHLATFAVARDWDRLGAALRRGAASEWGVATHLVALDLDEDTLTSVVQALPADSPEGTRLSLRAGGLHPALPLLDNVVARLLSERPRDLAAGIDVLVDAEPAVLDRLIPRVIALAAEPTGRTRFVGALARMLLASHHPDKSRWLAAAVDAVLSGDGDLTDGDLTTLAKESIGRDPGGFDCSLLLPAYGSVPPQVRAEVARSMAARDMSGEQRLEYLKVALRQPAPLLALDALVRVMHQAFTDPGIARRLGWTSWRDLLDTSPPSGWRMVQTTMLAQNLPPDHTPAVVQALWEPQLSKRKEYTDLAVQLADRLPTALTDALSSAGAPPTPPVASSMAHVVEALSANAGLRGRLKAMVEPFRAVDPLHIEPTLATLAVGDPVDTERIVLRLLSLSRENASSDCMRVVRRTWDALFARLSLMEVSRFEFELEHILDADGPRERERRVRLWARLAPLSQVARDQVERVILDRGLAHLAGEAAKVLEDHAADTAAPVDAGWLMRLLRSPHPRAAGVAADLLGEPALLPSAPASLMATVTDRAEIAIRQHEDQQLLRSLLGLAASLARAGSSATCVDAGDVHDRVSRLLALMLGEMLIWRHNGYDDRPELRGLYQNLTYGLTAVGVPLLTEDEVAALAQRLLVEVDTGRIGDKPRRSLANTLVVLIRHYPLLWGALDRCWSAAPADNKLAMAECVTSGAFPSADRAAQVLTRRPDCPPQVAHYIHRRIGTQGALA